jgi:hypothetical protein
MFTSEPESPMLPRPPWTIPSSEPETVESPGSASPTPLALPDRAPWSGSRKSLPIPDEKRTKADARYRHKSLSAREFCGNCVMFMPEQNRRIGICSRVEGTIDPDYVCDKWEPKR